MNYSKNLDQKESKKVVRTFSVASFLNDFGSDIIYPVWPLFVTSVLGANMAILGLIDGIGEAVVSLSQAGSGYLADKFRKRKIFIWIGYLFGAFSRIGYALSTTWHYILPIRVFDRMGKIRSAPRDAIVADVSTNENRGKNFGLLRTMDNLGAVCGILFCIIFFNLGFKTLFLIAAVPSLIGAVIVIIYIKEERNSSVKIFKGLSVKELSRNFWIFLISSSIFALGNFSYSFLLLYAKVAGIQQSSIPVMYLIFTSVAAAGSYGFGKMADKYGRKNLMFIAILLWIVTSTGFIIMKSYIGMVIIFILYGLHKAAIEPVQKTMVAELAPSAYRSSALGLFQMVIGLCAFPSSLVAGLLWEHVNLFAPLYLTIILALISAVMLFFIVKK